MKSISNTRKFALHVLAAGLVLSVVFVMLLTFFLTRSAGAESGARSDAGVLLTIHDRGQNQVVVTHATTLADALAETTIELAPQDVVEPALDQELISDEYRVNIYRARPITVVDGNIRQRVMTAYQTPRQIAKQVGISVYPEDKTEIAQSSDLLRDGAGLELRITRSVPFQFNLYGRTAEARTLGATIADMLEEKGIVLTEHDRVVPGVSTPITAGMEVRVWRDGKQTITVDEAVPFEVDQIRDANRPIGYCAIQSVGVPGQRSVTYEIEVENGVERSRKEIASISKSQPIKQVEVRGTYDNGAGLSKSMGVKMFTDCNGVTHRETYYDLPMSLVMQNCGQGGYYIVREDGVKVDVDGYIIVAAHLGRYPRCSVVETSLGPGKVYDTGGFATVHPDGFDLATDWTNRNGI